MSEARRETAAETATAGESDREHLDAMLSRLRDTLEATKAQMRFAMERQEVDLELLAYELTDTADEGSFGKWIGKHDTGNPELNLYLERLRQWTEQREDRGGPTNVNKKHYREAETGKAGTDAGSRRDQLDEVSWHRPEPKDNERGMVLPREPGCQYTPYS